jgi:hypothetical protein
MHIFALAAATVSATGAGNNPDSRVGVRYYLLAFLIATS